MNIIESLESWEVKDLVELLKYIEEYYLQTHGTSLEEVVREHTGSDEE